MSMEALHWFLDPIKHHYADFEGRVGRQEFWMYILFYIIAAAILNVVSDALGLLLALGLLVPNIAISARRLHDIGKSGWWQLISLIPIIGFIIMIVWLASKGEVAANMYGAVPADKTGPVTPGAATTAVVTPVAEPAAEATMAAPEAPAMGTASSESTSDHQSHS